ncbi:MAG: tripartite tricarboxylate transporter substrate binding protein [Ramlibacter sp.]
MNWTIPLARALAAAVLTTFALAAPAQQAYPNKPIRILVPFAPGGSLDPVARLVGEKLTLAWGQPVVVDNRPGGNTTIATLAAAKAPPDGHTILLTASTHVINPLLMANLPYDSEKDFIPLAIVIKSEFLLVVHPSVPANNLQEFIAYAKARPDKVDYATAGQGNGNHIAAELFNQVAGTRMKHVPYKGGAQAIADVIGGQVQLMFSVPSTAIPHVKSGKLRALAHTGTNAPRGLTGVPSFAQAGLPGYDLNSWQGFMVPAGTPKPIVDKLVAEITKIMADPEVQEKLAGTGQEVWFNGPEAFAAIMKSDKDKFGQIIRTANIKLE